MSLSAREFDLLVDKLGYRTRGGAHLLAWLEVDGKVVARTRRSRKSSGDLPMSHSIRQQMKMSETEMREAVACTLGRDAYLDILRGKGVL